MDNLEEVDICLERYMPPILNHEEIENMNKQIMCNWNWFKTLPTNKSPGPDSFIGKFYQTLSEELTPTILKLFQKIAEEDTLPSLCNKGTITLIKKQAKTNKQTKTQNTIPQKKRKLQANITDEHMWKNSQQNTSKQNSVMHEKDCTLWSSGIYLSDARIS